MNMHICTEDSNERQNNKEYQAIVGNVQRCMLISLHYVPLCTSPITNDINNTTAKIIYVRSSFRFVYSLFVKYCMSVCWIVAASGVKK